ncbi:hypothetical protein RxyAA322_10250 [Rubrobacter xylanophilus]|uniref:PAS/PAC sensor protein n=1 Tax=Rubrobacter xylanophilus TaxID=49319 RepID=A0A510HGU3_9ACTN|nr:SpoIIE family protein phosphatase [Rubrobacter xylanophilus]BBL79171.1 hypothetical protein RxyAA322_10250 [Rubrobacter xylanophilus]
MDAENRTPEPALASRVLAHVSDILLVLDGEGRIEYLNPAGAGALGVPSGRAAGMKLREVLPEAASGRVAEALERAAREGRTTSFELNFRTLGGWFAGRIYPVPDGLAVLLWDIAERREEQERYQRLYREKHRIARVLQEALLPPRLPEVPGIEVGGRYLAAAEGMEVGGDFYDVFAIENDGWALAIGDVTGKGPEAASLTSLARYTIRTAAMRVKRPRRVLAFLNREILRQTEGDRFFTVVYCELEPYRAGEGAVEIRVGCAGHPPPLVLRGDGEVETLPATGMILGAVEEPEVATWSGRLAAGEAMVLYTDGVTEARGPEGELFGEERLRRLVSGAVGMAADEVAHRIERAVLEFQQGEVRDDVAVLVARVQDPPGGV